MKPLALFASLVISTSTFARSPDCAGVDNWASNMAFGHLKNAGITNNDKILWGRRKVVRIASEKIGKLRP
jgi:hypothetical protein